MGTGHVSLGGLDMSQLRKKRLDKDKVVQPEKNKPSTDKKKEIQDAKVSTTEDLFELI